VKADSKAWAGCRGAVGSSLHGP